MAPNSKLSKPSGKATVSTRSYLVALDLGLLGQFSAEELKISLPGFPQGCGPRIESSTGQGTCKKIKGDIKSHYNST